MITENELKYYWGTGIKIKNQYGNIVKLHFGNVYNGYNEYIGLRDLPLICHPLSSLIKPVLEGGKIPIVELAKIADYRFSISHGDITHLENIEGDYRVIWEHDDLKHIFAYTEPLHSFTAQLYKNNRTTQPPVVYQHKLFEWLYQNHFWIFDQSYFKKGLLIDKSNYK